MRNIYCVGELFIEFISDNGADQLKDVQKFVMHAGGSPVYITVAISRLGKDSSIIGQVGNDIFGSFIKDTLASENVNIDYLRTFGETTLAFVTLDDQGKRSFTLRKGTIPSQNQLVTELPFDESSIIHFGSATAFLNKKLSECYQELLQYAKDKVSFISFSPTYHSFLITKDNLESYIDNCWIFMRNANVIKLNAEEAMLLTNQEHLSGAIEQLILEKLPPILITLGQQGTVLLMNGQYTQIPAISVQEQESPYANEAFVGGLLSKIAEQDKNDFNLSIWTEYIHFANVVSSLSLEQDGSIYSLP